MSFSRLRRAAAGESHGHRLVIRRQFWGFLFVLPSVGFFAVFLLYPMVRGIYLSLTNFTLFNDPLYIGFENYERLLDDRLFNKAFQVTLKFVLGSTVPVWILSLLIALLFFQEFRGREVLKRSSSCRYCHR